MKILLIQPPLWNPAMTPGLIEPLGLETIAANVNTHEMEILDMRIDSDLMRKLDDFKPDIVGITGVAPEYEVVCSVLGDVKKYSSNILTVVGGIFASLAPEEFKREFVDVIVIGEGEITFPELVEAYRLKRDFSKVKGIAYREGRQLCFTPSRERIKNLDDFPLPNRNLTRAHRVLYNRHGRRPVGAIFTTRGCTYKCDFCTCWKFSNGTFTKRGVESIVNELMLIDEELVNVEDDNTMLDLNFFEELYKAIRKAGIKKRFFIYGRSDSIARRPDIIEKWREIGLDAILVGLESFRDEDLIRHNKNNSIANNENAIHILKQNGVEIIGYFLIESSFSKEDFDALLNYIKKMKLTFVVVPFLTPGPGTDLYEKEKHNLITNDWQFFDGFHMVVRPTKLSIDEFLECCTKLLVGIYGNRFVKIKNNLSDKDKVVEKQYQQVLANYKRHNLK
ncbi:MAG TPA: cobalamin-dependent protein [bacterium]|nr:cobalamin-dependent protein [bacterium]